MPLTPVAESPSSASAHRGLFFRDGEFWRIGYDGESFGLKHSKGLAYLAQLLRYPQTEFHALDLVGGIVSASGDEDSAASSLPRGDDMLASAGIHVGGLGDAGEMLDDRAKAEYRRRLDELRDELEEAKRIGNVERAERVEGEIDSLTTELSRAVGLGGRNRRTASASERARQSVTHAIKSAIEKIGENHADLGRLLARSVRTGISCAYYPNPENPIVWQLGASDGERLVSVSAPSAIDPTRSPTPVTDALLSPTTPSRTSRTQMVGRAAEFAQLGRAAERALSGKGALLLLGGGPGVGKTRLASEFLDWALQRGFASLSGRCYERDEPHPLMPFVEIIEAALGHSPSNEHFRTLLGRNAAELGQIAPMLRRVFPDLPDAPELPAAQVRRYLFQGLFDFIARIAQPKPLVLMLDDLHWADESTLAMVNFLARRVEHIPVLVVATYRDGQLDTTPQLALTLEELLRLGIVPAKLSGLRRSGVAQMLADLCKCEPPEDLVTLIFEETQGNPFFVEEVFSHLLEEGRIFDAAGNFVPATNGDDLTVPENLRLVLGRRLARLSESAREMLSAASVIGRSFSFMLLETMLNPDDMDRVFDGLEEAQRTGFVTSNSQDPEAPFVFSHELIRQTLLAELSLPRQQRLHLKIAQALEKLYETRIEEWAAEVAHHLIKSGPLADAGRTSYYLSLTGQSLLRAGALEDARLSLNAALQYQQSNPARRAQVLAHLASVERGLGDLNAAIGHLEESLRLYVSVGDSRSVGRIVFEMVESFIWTGHFDEAAQITERSLSHLSSDEGAYSARLLTARGLIHAVRGEFSAAMSAFDEALATPAVTPFTGRVLAYRSVCQFYFLRLEQTLEDSQKSASLTNAHDSPWTHAIALSRVMLALYHLGKPDQALRICAELEPLARGIGHIAAMSFCASIQAWTEFGRDPDLVTLDRRIQNDVTTNRAARVPLFLAESLAQMGLVRFLAGDLNAARSIAEEGGAIEPSGVFRGLSAATVLRLAAYAGDRDMVLELAGKAESQLPKSGQPNPIRAWLLLMSMVEALAMVGENARAAALYPMVRELLASGAICMALMCRLPQTIAGIAAGAAGDWEVAEEHFRIALAQATELPHRLEEAEVRRFYTMMLLQRNFAGDRERARDMLVPAVESYGRIGMPLHLELARALLASAEP